MNWVLCKISDDSRCGVSVGNIKVTDRVFADDAFLLGKSLEVLVMAFEVMPEEA